MTPREYMNRRAFLGRLAAVTAGAVLLPAGYAAGSPENCLFDGIAAARNGTPAENLEKVIEMLGGMGRYVGSDDIVVIKPNCQWRNQGITNIAGVRRLIELILEMPGFSGEVIIAENIHRDPADSRGWTDDPVINFDEEKNIKNYNQLIGYFQDAGFANVSKYHLISTDKENGRIVASPEEGDGYVHTDIVYSFTDHTGVTRSAIMTYPVFTSSYSGITIDFKNGAWQNGDYLNRKVTFINTAVLNDHGSVNATASVKNLMGVVDLPGNETGRLPGDYYNFHSILTTGMGGALGTFMNTIRRPDLNIILAEWVGWGSRVDPSLATRARTVIAGTDPVALDYWATKYVLYPYTPADHPEKEYHHPDNDFTHLWKYLTACRDQGIGTMDEDQMIVSEYDFSTRVDKKKCCFSSGGIQIFYNYPNPFNASTTISVHLDAASSARVRIYNLRGRIVKTLIENRVLSRGPHEWIWDGTNWAGVRAASGLYLCEFTFNSKTFYQKMILKN